MNSCQGALPGASAQTIGDRILVIRLSALGDFVLALPAMAAIRRAHPDAKLTLLTTAPLVALAERSGWFDRIEIDDRPRWYDPAGWWRLRRRLRQGRYRRVYDLQAQDRTALYFRLFWPGRRPEWSGIAPGASHPHRDPARGTMHAADIHAAQLQQAGIAEIPAPDLGWLDADTARFGLVEPYALLVPGSAPHRPEKRWPAAQFAALAARLADSGLTPVVLGGADEAPLAARIRDRCAQAIDLTGRTSLFEIAGLARRAALAVGNDTGPMHLVAAALCPCTVLFSAASNPDRAAPRGAHVRILKRPVLADLTVDEVWASLETLTAGRAAGHSPESAG